MMKWQACSLVAFVVIGCGKGTPKMMVDPHLGGSIMLSQCNYSVSTVAGASVPQPGSASLGSGPTPKLVHLNVANDPRTGVAVLWRTDDDATLATTVQYGVGGKMDQTQEGFT